jgi:hypothetical protein
VAVYVVTGKLGSGKSLTAVGQILLRLLKGLPVATNIDIRSWKLLTPFKRNTRIIRVPDKPDVHDLDAIGIANAGYDESKNGLLVLDELGTWFNSRTWNDKTRQPVINWFLHSRKKGWDVILLVQDISVIDKQLRETLAEHHVPCVRSDRLTIPVVGFLWRLICGSKLPMPKGHLGVVKYGVSLNAPKVDYWFTRGKNLYEAYDTKQAFSSDYPYRSHSLLPPWYTHGRFMVPRDASFYMRLSKIYFRKISKLVSFGAGILTTVALLFAVMSFASSPVVDPPAVERVVLDPHDYKDYRLESYVAYPDRLPVYHLTDGDNSINTQSLLSLGFTVKGDSTYVEISNSNGDSIIITR